MILEKLPILTNLKTFYYLGKPFYLVGGGGGYGFLLHSENFSQTT
jgi:hypothetical protein